MLRRPARHAEQRCHRPRLLRRRMSRSSGSAVARSAASPPSTGSHFARPSRSARHVQQGRERRRRLSMPTASFPGRERDARRRDRRRARSDPVSEALHRVQRRPVRGVARPASSAAAGAAGPRPRPAAGRGADPAPTRAHIRIGGNQGLPTTPSADYIQVPPPSSILRADQLASHGAA